MSGVPSGRRGTAGGEPGRAGEDDCAPASGTTSTEHIRRMTDPYPMSAGLLCLLLGAWEQAPRIVKEIGRDEELLSAGDTSCASRVPPVPGAGDADRAVGGA